LFKTGVAEERRDCNKFKTEVLRFEDE